jgi:hypothetical protein
MNIISAKDLTVEQWNELEGADVICWQLWSSNGTTSDVVKSRITAVNIDYAKKGITPPLFVIFVENLDDNIVDDLFSEGATVFENKLPSCTQVSSNELIKATVTMLGEIGVHPHHFQTVNSVRTFKQGSSWDSDKEIPESTDSYREIVDLSKA